MNRIDRESLALYSIDMLLQDRSRFGPHTRRQLADALVVSEPTLDLYLCRLKRGGYIDRRKRRFAREIKGIISLTPKGRSKVRRIQKTVDKIVLSKEGHNIPEPIRLTDVFDRLVDPIERVFLLSLSNLNPSYDLVTYLMVSEISHDETNLINALFSIENPWAKGRSRSFPQQLFNASLYGNVNGEILSSAFPEKSSVDALLLLAEAKMRIGRFDEVRALHDHVRSYGKELTADQRLILVLDRATVLVKDERPQEALKEIERALKRPASDVHGPLLRLMKASIMTNHLDRTSRKDHFKECIKAFDNLGLPLLASRAYDLRGMSHLKVSELGRAEDDLVQARKAAIMARSPIAEARVLLDLSKLTVQRGMFDLSKSYLKRARDLFEGCSNLELISYTMFQMALLELERGRPRQAVRNYRNCGRVAYPLPPVLTLLAYRDQLILRAGEQGDENVQRMIYTM